MAYSLPVYSPPVYSPGKVEGTTVYEDPYRAAAGREKDTLVDTGVRLSPRGGMALCSRLGYEQLGLVCAKCHQLSMTVKPWTSCESCGEALWDILPEAQKSTSYRLDWSLGYLKLSPTPAPSAVVESATSTPLVITPTVSEGPVAAAEDPRLSTVRSKSSYMPTSQRTTPGAASSSRSGESKGIGRGRSVTPSASVCPRSPVMDTTESESEQGEERYMSAEEARVQDQGETPVERPSSFRPPRTGPLIPDQPAVTVADSPPSTPAALRARRLAKLTFIKKSPDACVLPGLGNLPDMTGLSRHQRNVNKRVAKYYGYEYPYVPEDIMDVIEKRRQSWCEEEVWDHLGIPHAFRSKEAATMYLDNFNSCMDTWGFGRTIFKDRVVVKRPGKPDLVKSSTVMNKEGLVVRVPDPRFYL